MSAVATRKMKGVSQVCGEKASAAVMVMGTMASAITNLVVFPHSLYTAKTESMADKKTQALPSSDLTNSPEHTLPWYHMALVWYLCFPHLMPTAPRARR